MLAGRVRRVLSAGPPEASIPYRTAVAAAVLVSVVAAVTNGAVLAGVGVVALGLIPAGFVVSYLRRGHRNVILKLALAAGLFMAFGGFLDGVRGSTSLDDTRVPLAALFLWVQVLHSFDVPRRRDLAFSIASSVALTALAGSLAFSTGFLAVVVVYAAALLTAFGLGHLAELRDGAPGTIASEVGRGGAAPSSLVRPPKLVRPLAGVAAITVLFTGVAFVFMPRLPGIRVAALPFSLAQRSPIGDFAGGVVQPPRRGDGSGGAASRAFDPDTYFGYGERLDLRTRGRLSDELVLRVRAPEPAMYRAQVYDVYDGTAWVSSDEQLDTVRQDFDGSTRVRPSPEGNFAKGHELVQTFYVERALPNLVFHAYQARELYVPSTTTLADDFSSFRLPFILEEDTIYSVISYIPDATVEDLRGAPLPRNADPRLARYLQLPDTTSGRFRELAQDITGAEPTTADKALAVERWLHANKRYRIDIPPDPPGRDPVDVFVFDRTEGFCEQIATTMTLMLRASGVPARLVTGFGPGERNLFTGYWEIHNSDAHAWVEVFYPGFGWIAYDPTFGVPVSSAATTTFMFEPLARTVGDLVPAAALRDVAAAVTGLLGPAGTLAAAAAVLGAAVVLLRRGRRPGRPKPVTPRERAAAAWLRVEDALARTGCMRAPHETVREFAPRARRHPGIDAAALDRLISGFSAMRYGRREPTDEEADRLNTLAEHIVEGLADAKAPAFAVRR